MDGEPTSRETIAKLEKLLQKLTKGSSEGKGLNDFNNHILDAYNEKILSKDEMVMILSTANYGRKK